MDDTVGTQSKYELNLKVKGQWLAMGYRRKETKGLGL